MGLQVALASSSSRACIEQVLTQCGIRELFDCIVSVHSKNSQMTPTVIEKQNATMARYSGDRWNRDMILTVCLRGALCQPACEFISYPLQPRIFFIVSQTHAK